jgi:hypothetical protein
MVVHDRGQSMRHLRSLAAALLAAASISALAATPALATFHEMSIREVYPAGDSSYVELQMWAGGQNFVGTHHLVVYNSGGGVADNFEFANDVPNGANQSTIVVADTGYPVTFDEMPSPDETDPSLDLSPTAGAVCWTEGSPPDCVAWGSFSGAGSLPSPIGLPVAPGGVPTGMAIRRSISAGCPTFLEPNDDHDNSAADFDVVFPGPRPNSIVPSETRCASPGNQADGGGGGQGGRGGQGTKGAPQTSLKRKPPHKTHDRTPTFRFVADEQGSTFQCKLDRKPFRSCRSPFTARKLTLGPHTFKVRARDESGKPDPSPTSYSFRVVAKR